MGVPLYFNLKYSMIPTATDTINPATPPLATLPTSAFLPFGGAPCEASNKIMRRSRSSPPAQALSSFSSKVFNFVTATTNKSWSPIVPMSISALISFSFPRGTLLFLARARTTTVGRPSGSRTIQRLTSKGYMPQGGFQVRESTIGTQVVYVCSEVVASKGTDHIRYCSSHHYRAYRCSTGTSSKYGQSNDLFFRSSLFLRRC